MDEEYSWSIKNNKNNNHKYKMAYDYSSNKLFEEVDKPDSSKIVYVNR